MSAPKASNNLTMLFILSCGLFIFSRYCSVVYSLTILNNTCGSGATAVLLGFAPILNSNSNTSTQLPLQTIFKNLSLSSKPFCKSVSTIFILSICNPNSKIFSANLPLGILINTSLSICIGKYPPLILKYKLNTSILFFSIIKLILLPNTSIYCPWCVSSTKRFISSKGALSSNAFFIVVLIAFMPLLFKGTGPPLIYIIIRKKYHINN